MRKLIPLALFIALITTSNGYSEDAYYESLKLKEDHLNYKTASKGLERLRKTLGAFDIFVMNAIPRKVLKKIEAGEKVQISIDKKTLGSTTYFHWDMRVIGGHNAYLNIKGTLLLNEAKIKQLEYRLAMSESKVSKKELAELKESSKLANKAYKDFLDKAMYAD